MHLWNALLTHPHGLQVFAQMSPLHWGLLMNLFSYNLSHLYIPLSCFIILFSMYGHLSHCMFNWLIDLGSLPQAECKLYEDKIFCFSFHCSGPSHTKYVSTLLSEQHFSLHSSYKRHNLVICVGPMGIKMGRQVQVSRAQWVHMKMFYPYENVLSILLFLERSIFLKPRPKPCLSIFDPGLLCFCFSSQKRKMTGTCSERNNMLMLKRNKQFRKIGVYNK